MTVVVIDTNVLLIANQQHDDVSPKCVKDCVERLQALQHSGVVAIDDKFRILGEYRQKTRLNPPKGVGDVFLKWLLRESGNPRHVNQVAITESAENQFNEFPDAVLQATFDAPDRKFVAVAFAHPKKPRVWQAADCKWIDWWSDLRKIGVEVEFLCADDACRFYRNKFPGRAIPPLPNR